MKKPFKILLATDYSHSSKSAIRYALNFALETHSFLEILHVFTAPFESDTISGILELERIDPIPAQLEEKKLRSYIDDQLNLMQINRNDLKYECAAREGNISRAICKEAKEMGFDFIIMGSHGAGGFRQYILGNHTWEVIQRAEIPVLSIPENAHFTGIKNMVYITGLKNEELDTIHFLAGFASLFNAEITVLRITEEATSTEKEISIPFIQNLKTMVNYPNLTLQKMSKDNIIENLDSFCIETRADWVVTSIEEPGYLEKIFTLNPDTLLKKLTLYSHTPFLSIKMPYTHSDKEKDKTTSKLERLN